MKAVIVVDSFKGCLTSMEANQAAADAVRSVCPDAEVIQIPVSDGGEGFLMAFHAAVGGELVQMVVNDPLMRPVRAGYLLWGKTAVIEMAQASGLTLLKEEERNPVKATTYGTGQLVADAVRKGVEHIIVGLGGSATSDAGMGMLKALVDAFSQNGRWDGMEPLKKVRFTLASDVRNPLYGSHGAAYVFGPQKGATPQMVAQLDQRARHFAEISERHFGFDRSGMEGAGAAGGLGYAFLQYLDAECQPGIRLLLDTIRFKDLISGVDFIVTGEGAADRQTLMGKLPMGVLELAGQVPVMLIAGKINDREQLLQAGFARVECINPAGISLEEAMRKEVAVKNIHHTVCGMVHDV